MLPCRTTSHNLIIHGQNQITGCYPTHGQNQIAGCYPTHGHGELKTATSQCTRSLYHHFLFSCICRADHHALTWWGTFFFPAGSKFLLIFHHFYEKNFYIVDVLMQRISLSHPEEKFIHWFPQNMEGAWPATPLLKKWKEAQILVAGFIPSFSAKSHKIWKCSTQLLLAP